MKTTYSGACHCGKVKFEIDADIDHVRVCDCSICSKRGALIHRVANKNFRLLTPLDELALYEWGTRTAKDYFCPVCGILPFRRPSQLTEKELASQIKPFDGWAINARCLDGFDVSGISVTKIKGRQL